MRNIGENKVNAIIKAAGMSTRFLPLSLESPKGLLKVKGEIMIERQINQLIEAGIKQIIIVVGYKAEMFKYLERKYSCVKLIYNPNYFKTNTMETIRCAKKYLGNTFICSSDNYFVYNPFLEKPTYSYYSCDPHRKDPNDLHLVSSKNNKIIEIIRGGNKGSVMIGHSFWNKEFSNKIIKIIEKEYKLGNYSNDLWEILLKDYLNELPPIYKKDYPINYINEFDTLDELRRFDDDYIKQSHSKVIDNIAKTFKCKFSNVHSFKLLKNGRTNISFKFSVRNNDYVYRHPGILTNEIISRTNEKQSLEIAKRIKIDESYLCMNVKEGWKISKYIEDSHLLDFSNSDECKLALDIMKKLHGSNKHVDYKFDVFKAIDKEINYINEIVYKGQPNKYIDLYIKIKKIYPYLKKNRLSSRFSHCDTCRRNWLVSKTGVTLIDWEYAAEAEPGVDIGYFICDGMFSFEEAKNIIKYYCGEKYDCRLLKYFIGYTSLISFYWSLWAFIRETKGITMGNSVENWFKMAECYIVYFNNLKD